MIYFITFLFISFFYIPYNNTEIDPILKPYYNEYMDLVNEYCVVEQYNNVKFKLVFGDLTGDQIGVCETFPNSFKITIDRDAWNSYSPDSRFQLEIHELLHCTMGIQHSNDPTSIMYYSIYFVSKENAIKQLRSILKNRCS